MDTNFATRLFIIAINPILGKALAPRLSEGALPQARHFKYVHFSQTRMPLAPQLAIYFPELFIGDLEALGFGQLLEPKRSLPCVQPDALSG